MSAKRYTALSSFEMTYLIVLPACLRQAGRYCINYWIPAFAGMTTSCKIQESVIPACLRQASQNNAFVCPSRPA